MSYSETHLATAIRIHQGQHGTGCDACVLARALAELIKVERETNPPPSLKLQLLKMFRG